MLAVRTVEDLFGVGQTTIDREENPGMNTIRQCTRLFGHIEQLIALPIELDPCTRIECRTKESQHTCEKIAVALAGR